MYLGLKGLRVHTKEFGFCLTIVNIILDFVTVISTKLFSNIFPLKLYVNVNYQHKIVYNTQLQTK